MRFHLIDRIEELSYGHYITAVKCITLADEVFNEHFPGYPVFPGSLILEGLAQLGGAFFELMMKHHNEPVRRSILSIIQHFKFRNPVMPGDKLVYRAQLITMREEYGVVKVTAFNEDEICAEGELTFTFLEVHDDTLHQSRMELYKVCMKKTRIIP